MSDKSLKSKAINIKGKNYVLVSDRILYFNETYPNGSIQTNYTLNNDIYIVKAIVIPDVANSERKFGGTSQALIGDGMVNKTAALENAETSAVGRALAMMGIGVIESIASADEVVKATAPGVNGVKYATEKQIKWIRDTVLELEDGHTYETADIDKIIEEILTIPVTKVPIFKVKDAVDKIKETYKLDTSKDSLVVVDGKTYDLNELPY